MRRYLVAKISGIFLMFFSLSMLTPIAVSWYYDNGDQFPFYLAFSITLTTGFSLWLPVRRVHAPLTTRDGFIIVILMWVILSLFGALPFVISYQPDISFSAAVFETISGLSTTGATVIPNIDKLPEAVLYYRQQLQFLGGMGIIVLAIAIMPLIGVGGMQLYKAEATGIQKEDKIAPRIAETAKTLWLTYVTLTILCALSYRLLGMSDFDAICYAFSTLSTGGYAPRSAGMLYYNDYKILSTAIFFMLLGGINFSLHVYTTQHISIRHYFRNTECRLFLMLMFGIALLYGLILFEHHADRPFLNALFQIVSFGTSTGYISDPDYANWPSFLPIGLMFVAIIGACAGSTTGGIKIIRVMLVFKLIHREIKRLIHPKGVFAVKVNGQPIRDSIQNSVWAFLGAYSIILCLFWLCLLGTGLDTVTAFSAIVTCISNTGPGLGAVSIDFSHTPTSAQWILSLAMLAGRLEIFTVLVLFTPAFWRA